MPTKTCACGQPFWLEDGQAFEHCFFCANSKLENAYGLCAPCDPDTDYAECMSALAGTCEHADLCKVLAGAVDTQSAGTSE